MLLPQNRTAPGSPLRRARENMKVPSRAPFSLLVFLFTPLDVTIIIALAWVLGT